MASTNPEINFFSLYIGMGNRASAAVSLSADGDLPNYGSVHRLVADGPFTTLARFTQSKVTHSLKGSRAYSNATVQGFLRNWVAPYLVGIEGYRDLIAHTPKLRPHEQRILVSTTELVFLPYLSKISKKFSPYFTHLALLVADTYPKPTAERMLKITSTQDMPIHALVSPIDTSARLISSGIPTIGIAPPLAYKRRPNHSNRPPISILKEPGTGMDEATRAYFINLMRVSGVPHAILNEMSQIQTDVGTSQPTHLTHLYRTMSQQNLHMLATHASEMTLAQVNNPPNHLYLATSRGVQEENNRAWVSAHFDTMPTTDHEAALNIAHLMRNENTFQSLQDSIHHTPLLIALLKSLAPSSIYLRAYP